MSTIRVLEIDGGGARGLIPNTWLKLFLERWGVDPTKIWNYFDVICGTSVGGILAIAYAFGKSPDDLTGFFTDTSQLIFTTNGIRSDKASGFTKAGVMLGSPGFSNTFYPAGKGTWGVDLLYSTLQSVVGEAKLSDLKTSVIIPSFQINPVISDFDQGGNVPIYFSNVPSNIAPGLIGADALCSDVASATSAAPLYFPVYEIAQKSYIDGGVAQNNCSAFGLELGKAINLAAERYCILSLGTGLGQIGFTPSQGQIFDNMQRLLQLVQIGIAGPQEYVAQQLGIASQYAVNNLFYYRMNYKLDPNIDTELDTTTNEVLGYYQSSATNYFNSDLSNIDAFLGHLEHS